MIDPVPYRSLSPADKVVSTNLGMNCVSFVDVMKFLAKMTVYRMERNARGPPCPLSRQINICSLRKLTSSV